MMAVSFFSARHCQITTQSCGNHTVMYLHPDKIDLETSGDQVAGTLISNKLEKQAVISVSSNSQDFIKICIYLEGSILQLEGRGKIFE